MYIYTMYINAVIYIYAHNINSNIHIYSELCHIISLQCQAKAGLGWLGWPSWAGFLSRSDVGAWYPTR